jgi:hypothetical protein
MLDVFQIIYFPPNFPGQPTGFTKDLLVHYSSITEKQVAESCEWYHNHTVKDYYRENLQLSADLIENNTTDVLWEKCIEAQDDYQIAQRGGPLLFSIMMRLLQSHARISYNI